MNVQVIEAKNNKTGQVFGYTFKFTDGKHFDYNGYDGEVSSLLKTKQGALNKARSWLDSEFGERICTKCHQKIKEH
jgi:hypothetical protein